MDHGPSQEAKKGTTPTKDQNNNVSVMSAEGWEKFDKAIFYIFNTWTALELAINFNWGGKKSKAKIQNLQDDVLYLFRSRARKHKVVYSEEVEDILLDMLDRLHTIVEDDSTVTVTDLILKIHKECLNLDYKEVDKLELQYNLKNRSGKSLSLLKSVKAAQQYEGEEEDDNGYYEGDFNDIDENGEYYDEEGEGEVEEEEYEEGEDDHGDYEGDNEIKESKENKEQHKEPKNKEKEQEEEEKETNNNKQEDLKVEEESKDLKEEKEEKHNKEQPTKEETKELKQDKIKTKGQKTRTSTSTSTPKKKKGKREKQYDADGWEIVKHGRRK